MHRHGRDTGYDAERRAWQDPEAILGETGLQPGDTFVDLGCGQGFFAIPAARIVSASGRVLGVDVREAPITTLRDRARIEGLSNIEVTHGRAEDAVLCEGCADMVFIGIALHDFVDPARVLGNARRMIKAGGKLVNLDWKYEKMEIGPPLQIRFSEEKASHLIEQAGFDIVDVGPSGKYHYVITATPRAPA